MKARGWTALFFCAWALLVLPTGAAAKPGYFVTEPLRFASIHLEGSHGYHLRIDAFDTNVNVGAEKGDAQVGYTAYRGFLRGDRIWARLPGVGWVNLRFEEHRRYRRDPAYNCMGPGELIRLGVFRGRFKLQGELGYTHVDIRAVEGKISSEQSQVCRRSHAARASAAPGEELIEAVAPRGSGVLSFKANEWALTAGAHPVFFSADLWRQRGQLRIRNIIGGFTEDPRAVRITTPPLSASVTPPRPFIGTATFQGDSNGKPTWLGDLEAELPGIGLVALAGPHFEARVCEGRNCQGDSLPESPFFSGYGSGSHSQPLALARLSSL